MLKIIQSIMHSPASWRYFFWDLPLWAIGLRSTRRWSRMQKSLATDANMFRNSLRTVYRDESDTGPLEEAIEKALLVKAMRNSDAFACLGFKRHHPTRHFDITGLEHLRTAAAQNRPVMLLTGHVGSFYTITLALAQLGIKVDALARTVDESRHNPLPQQFFEHCNYYFTQLKMSGRYVFTNYANRLDRSIVTTLKDGGVLLVLPDIPRRFIPQNRLPVQFLGNRSSLPSRIVDLGIKYNAVFLTAWNTIEIGPGFSSQRHLRIDPIIPGDARTEDILQTYADRLSELVNQEPWQWMGTAIIDQYNENAI